MEVAAGEAYKVVLWRELRGCIALQPCQEQPVVLIQDRGSNTLSDLPETAVAASIYGYDGASSTSYTLAGSSSSTSTSGGSLGDLVVKTKEGRADFGDILVNMATVGDKTLSIAFSASIYNVAVQVGLRVSDVPAALVWELEPPATSAAGVAWSLSAQPVIIVIDSSGLRVEADSKTHIILQLVAAADTLAAGHVEGLGPRDAGSVVLGNTRSKCCRGRCSFTDLSVGLAGKSYVLRATAVFAPLHTATAASAAQPRVQTKAEISSRPFDIRGCFAALTCNMRGACADAHSAAPSVRRDSSRDSNSMITSNTSGVSWSNRGEYKRHRATGDRPDASTHAKISVEGGISYNHSTSSASNGSSRSSRRYKFTNISGYLQNWIL